MRILVSALECSYRRSAESDMTAPLVDHLVWPPLLQGARVLMRGEATTRLGSFRVRHVHSPLTTRITITYVSTSSPLFSTPESSRDAPLCVQPVSWARELRGRALSLVGVWQHVKNPLLSAKLLSPSRGHLLNRFVFPHVSLTHKLKAHPSIDCTVVWKQSSVAGDLYLFFASCS